MVSITKTLRPAIAMIELIFALVIMGIVMMSAPMLISTATQSTFVALQQEGVNEAASRMNMIMGYQWDENNTNTLYIAPILTVNAGAGDLARILTTARRIGTPAQSSRTFILTDTNTTLLNASVLQSDGGDLDDIDDFGGTTLNLVQATVTDYLEQQISIATGISYMDDTVVGGYSQAAINFAPFVPLPNPTDTSNIKFIQVTLTSTSGTAELAKNIILNAFSCNIGGYVLEERVF